MKISIPKLFFYSSLLLAITFISIISISLVSAQSIDAEKNIQFPINELGNCRNKEECKTYCDHKDNMSACVSFAAKNGLISQKEAERARKFEVLNQKTGPGGCTDHKSCEAYCSNINNINECIAFAEEHGLMGASELSEAKKVRSALQNGLKFPGGCTNKESCDTYCSAESHIDECVSFAEKSGFIPKEKLDNARKFVPFMKRGETPGGCTNKESCDAYCSDESHINECVNFGEKSGFINKDEADLIRKTGGKGPGGCIGKEQCDAFCSNEDNGNICFEFAKQHNLISEEQRQNIEQARNHFKESISRAPSEVVSCINSSASADIINKIKTSENFLPPRELAEKIKTCFEANLPKGPGGCTDKNSCEVFCSDEANREICFNFAKERGHLPLEAQNGSNGLGDFIRQAPVEVSDCFQEKLNAEQFEKIKSGSFSSNQETGNIIKECFKGYENRGPGNFENRQDLPFINNEGPNRNFIPGDIKERLKSAEESGDQELINKIKNEVNNPNQPTFINQFRQNNINNQINNLPQDVLEQIKSEGLTPEEYRKIHEPEFKFQEENIRNQIQPINDSNRHFPEVKGVTPENIKNLRSFNPEENFGRPDNQNRTQNLDPAGFQPDRQTPYINNNQGPAPNFEPSREQQKLGEQGASLMDIFFGFLNN